MKSVVLLVVSVLFSCSLFAGVGGEYVVSDSKCQAITIKKDQMSSGENRVEKYVISTRSFECGLFSNNIYDNRSNAEENARMIFGLKKDENVKNYVYKVSLFFNKEDDEKMKVRESEN